MRLHSVTRLIAGIACMLGLLIVFLFQQTDIAFWFRVEDVTTRFVFNKSLRFLMNDFLVVGLIYSIFGERKYVIFALWVQVTGMIVILIPYFLLKLVWHTGNGPLVSFLHRLVINPMLLLLLIPSFYVLKSKKS